MKGSAKATSRLATIWNVKEYCLEASINAENHLYLTAAAKERVGINPIILSFPILQS